MSDSDARIDGPTPQALARAFADFDKDTGAHVAVFHGANGHFCAGADLRAMARRNRLEPDGDGPMGPSRMLLSKPVIAAISGYAVAGGLANEFRLGVATIESGETFGGAARFAAGEGRHGGRTN